MILPAMGMVSDIISLLRPQADLRLQADGLLHRRYCRAWVYRLGPPHVRLRHEPCIGHDVHGLDDDDRASSAIKVFNWLGTIWGGKIQFTTPMLVRACRSSRCSSSVGCRASSWRQRRLIFSFTIHTLSWHISITCCSAGTAMGVFGSIYFWYPKMFGRMMNETWGKVHFILTFIFLNCTFYPMHILGRGRLPATFG